MEKILIIGMDGGATKMSGWTIERDPQKEIFRTGSTHLVKNYHEYPEYDPLFKPVGLSQQLQELNGNLNVTLQEKKQSLAYLQAAVDVLTGIIAQHPGQMIIAGFGMPGIKTADKRGIAALANGPRMPDYCNLIEEKLQQNSISLAHPITRLGSDADYCGLGEELAEKGLFAEFKNAYYLGGGTGVADAIKLNGQLVPFDAIKTWIAKTWEMKSTNGMGLEKCTSARGIQMLYSEISGIPIQTLDLNRTFGHQILQKAIEGDKAAVRTLEITAKHVGRLLFERIQTVYGGWAHLFDFINPNRTIEQTDHPYRGILLEKLILGQRLGELMASSASTPFLYQQVLDELTSLLIECDKGKLSQFYLKNGRFDSSRLAISGLREAPAIGAGIDAWLSFQKKGPC